jgi:transposase
MLQGLGVTEANWPDAGKKDPNFLESESPLYVGRAVLRSACRKMGLGSVARRQRPKLWWKAPEVQAVLSLGEKYRDMAATLGIGMGALNSIIRQSRQAGLGPARRYQNLWKTPEVQAVLQSGKKYREMAAELGIGMSVLAWGISESRRAGLGPPRRYKARPTKRRAQRARFMGT